MLYLIRLYNKGEIYFGHFIVKLWLKIESLRCIVRLFLIVLALRAQNTFKEHKDVIALLKNSYLI